MRFLLDLLSDLRYAFRAFRRNPAFAVTGIFCLALGIGANVTIFSITTAGVLTTLHSFANTDGANPAAALVQGIDGNLYGTTSAGEPTAPAQCSKSLWMEG